MVRLGHRHLRDAGVSVFREYLRFWEMRHMWPFKPKLIACAKCRIAFAAYGAEDCERNYRDACPTCRAILLAELHERQEFDKWCAANFERLNEMRKKEIAEEIAKYRAMHQQQSYFNDLARQQKAAGNAGSFMRGLGCVWP